MFTLFPVISKILKTGFNVFVLPAKNNCFLITGNEMKIELKIAIRNENGFEFLTSF